MSMLVFLVAGLVACGGSQKAEPPIPAKTFTSINLIPGAGSAAPDLVVIGPRGRVKAEDKKPTDPATSTWTVEFHKGSCNVYICGPVGCRWYKLSDGACPPGF